MYSIYPFEIQRYIGYESHAERLLFPNTSDLNRRHISYLTSYIILIYCKYLLRIQSVTAIYCSNSIGSWENKSTLF